MKRKSTDKLVFERMFPNPRSSDPPSFNVLIQRHLIMEVRHEVTLYYGHLDTQEAKYPGLDYCHPTHRLRLGRWTWHRRLFRAFDALQLTKAEIDGLTKWEGTKWAKEQFEKEQGITVRDTTADAIGDYVPPENRPSRQPRHEIDEEEALLRQLVGDAEVVETDDDEDGELRSVGAALNERLRERVAQRIATGDTTLPLDEAWEQWLKQALESGELDHITRVASTGIQVDDIVPRRWMEAARAGNWPEIPDFMHELVRLGLGSEERDAQTRGTEFRRVTVAVGIDPSRLTVVRDLGSTSERPMITWHPRRGDMFTARTRLELFPPRQREVYTSGLRLPRADGAPTEPNTSSSGV